MAVSRFAYVREFELPDPLLPATFIVLRIDGHSFNKFTDVHRLAKPNDSRGLELMDHAAHSLMRQYPDIVLAFGQSDEYSFLFRKSASLYNRRRSKILSIMCSHFTAAYVMHWRTYFPDTTLSYPPSFDARIVLFPNAREVRDYFSWRQADTYINNLYNTVFWALIRDGGQSPKDAHESLRGTQAGHKQEILYSRFGINYNALPMRFRKGSVLVREQLPSGGEIDTGEVSPTQIIPRTNSLGTLSSVSNHTLVGPDDDDDDGLGSPRSPHRRRNRRQESTRFALLHCDIIEDEFWNCRPYLLEDSLSL